MLHITTAVAIFCLLWTSNGLNPVRVRPRFGSETFRPKPRGFYGFSDLSSDSGYDSTNYGYDSSYDPSYSAGYYDSSYYNTGGYDSNYYNSDSIPKLFRSKPRGFYDYTSTGAIDSSFYNNNYPNYYNSDSYDSYDPNSMYYPPKKYMRQQQQQRMRMPMVPRMKPRMVPVLRMQQRMVRPRIRLQNVRSFQQTNNNNAGSQCINNECASQIQNCEADPECMNAIQKTQQNACQTQLDCSNANVMCDTGSAQCISAWNEVATCYMNKCHTNDGTNCVEQKCNNYGDVDACKANNFCKAAFQSASNGNCGNQCTDPNYMCNGDSTCIQIFQNLVNCYNAVCDNQTSTRQRQRTF